MRRRRPTQHRARLAQFAHDANKFNLVSVEARAVAAVLLCKLERLPRDKRDESIILGLASILVDKLDELCAAGQPMHDTAEALGRAVRS